DLIPVEESLGQGAEGAVRLFARRALPADGVEELLQHGPVHRLARAITSFQGREQLCQHPLLVSSRIGHDCMDPPAQRFREEWIPLPLLPLPPFRQRHPPAPPSLRRPARSWTAPTLH